LVALTTILLALPASLFVADRRLVGGKKVLIAVPDDDRLVGTYCGGSTSGGVVVLEGFGSDQTAMRAPASAFCRMGAHVLTLDFSGHGRSPGALGFDNAATDRLARQTIAAINVLREEAGIETTDVVLWGHSMGARVGLQAATMLEHDLAGLVLVGAQVNLSTNVQSEFFTGVQDSNLEWVRSLGPGNPTTDILLISGEWDDILKPDAARLLLGVLAGDPASDEGVVYGEAGATRELALVPALVHNYEVFSPRVLDRAVSWASQRWASGATRVAVGYWRVAAWVANIVALFAFVRVGTRCANRRSADARATPAELRVVHLWRFILVKLALWLGALPVAGLLGAPFFVLPYGLPAFNLIYVGFIGSYGLIHWLLYATGRMPGTTGRLGVRAGQREHAADSGWFAGLLVGALLLALTALCAGTGLFTVPPLGARLLWLGVFTPVTAVGFWAGDQEVRMPGAPAWAITLVNLAPFFLWTLFQLGLGSLSGVVTSAHGLLILALAILAGRLIRVLSGRPWLAAFVQASLLYWLILPQGVLFSL
jgi:pimeloyl-ACP methyl ester carboxylesterase